MITDLEILESALAHFESRCQEIRRQIGALRHPGPVAKTSAPATPVETEAPKGRRKMSAGARKRIAAAQKARWEKFHSAQKPAVKTKAAPKKKLSPARKAALVANLAKARAARAAKRKGA